MTENRAVAFTEFGDPSVLQVVTLPVPVARAGAGPGACRGGDGEPD